jgi:hypothetical protein
MSVIEYQRAVHAEAADGEFTDNSVGATYRGRDLAEPVRN